MPRSRAQPPDREDARRTPGAASTDPRPSPGESRPSSGKPRPEERRAGLLDRATRLMTRGGLRPRNAAYLIVAFWLVAIVVFAVIERIADPTTFPTIWLALWWAIQTVTTVGYGDIVPSQVSGKAFAAVLMLGGLSLLTVVTAAITSGFVGLREAERQERGEDPVVQRLDALAARLDAIEARLGERER